MDLGFEHQQLGASLKERRSDDTSLSTEERSTTQEGVVQSLNLYLTGSLDPTFNC